MNGATQIAQDVMTSAPSSKGRLGKVSGLAIVAILPALFWTALLAFFGPMLGLSISVVTLIAIGAGIAVFLGLIFSALVLSS